MIFTRFERSRILGARALQISMGAPAVLDASGADIDPLLIAVREYQAGSIPLTVQRFPYGHD